MITVHHVPTHFVHKEWPLVAPFLEAALTNPEASGDITLDQMRADLGQNRSALYMFVGDLGAVGAASVVFQNQRNARVAVVTAIGGKGLADPGVAAQFFDLLRRGGATRVAGAGRDSIVQALVAAGLEEEVHRL
jgi:16S rRNA C1402 (ribose-2'-O) methylase RsmI